MVSPQKENGYTAIANEILEKIVATPLPAGELRLLFFVLRKTYGYQKKEDKISLTQFEKGLKLSRPTVSKYLKNLKVRNILVVTPLLAIKFNKDWDSWVVATPLLVKNKKNPGSYAPTESGSPAPTHKRKKENTKDTYAGTSPAMVVAVIDSFKEVNPTYKDWYRNTTQRSACQWLITEFGFEATQKMIESLLKINAIKYAPTTTSPYELKQNYAKIKAFAEKERSFNNKKGFII